MRKYLAVLLICILPYSCGIRLPTDYRQYTVKPEPVVLRTRIVIETANVVEGEGSQTVRAVGQDTVFQYLYQTKDFWEELNIDFMVISVTYIKQLSHRLDYLWEDAERYPDYLTIIFALPRQNLNYCGIAHFPWSVNPHGIVIMNSHDASTLPHELGHYFGLFHTFELDDLVDDTPFHGENTCKGVPNIMSYCTSSEFIVTPGQISRAMFFLKQYRQDEVINPQSVCSTQTWEELLDKPYGPEECPIE